ncbi:unnamed protein product [Ectocarpus sp. CCAP 1310/34]|nr:unnamed protein product [Ectocarpus sp. CCAP 1310/34]
MSAIAGRPRRAASGPSTSNDGALPHGRPLEGASLDSVSALFLALTQAGDAATPPEIFKVGLAARAAGVSDEDNDARVKRALV